MPTIKRNVLREQRAKIRKLVASKAVIQMIEEIDQAPKSKQAEVASRVATVDELRRRGVEVDKSIRLSLRVFEDPSKPLQKTLTFNGPGGGTEGEVTVCESIGYIICLTAGKVITIDEDGNCTEGC